MHSKQSSGRVLILGGSGFIGTHLSSLLIGDATDVRIGDCRESPLFPHIWTQCDVTNSQSVRELASGASVIVNLAAEHRDDVRPVSRYHNVNVNGAVQVCKAAREAGVQKIVFTSSAAVYGFHQQVIDETGPFKPFNEYGRTKLEAEAVYQAWAAEDPGRTLVIVRPTVVFGEGNRGNVYNLLRQIANKKFFMVGSGDNIKSMAYVGNVAAFLAHSLTLGPGIHITNYVDTPDLTTRDLVYHVYRCLGRPPRVRTIPKIIAMAGGHLLDVVGRLSSRTFPVSAVRVRKFCESTQFKAERVAEWGFKPPYTLTEGLSHTIQYEFLRKSSRESQRQAIPSDFEAISVVERRARAGGDSGSD